MKERKELYCGTFEECQQWRAAQEKGDAMEIERNESGPPYSVFWERRQKDRTIKAAVSRETRALFKVQGVTRDHSRPLVVTLEPGDVISFRPKGTQQKVSIPIAHAYNGARFVAARAIAHAKRNAKKGAK